MQQRIALNARLTPARRITIDPADDDGLFATPAHSATAIIDAFQMGSGYGLLRLGAAEVGTDLSPNVGYWREFAHRFVSAACLAVDPTSPTAVVPESAAAALDELAHSAPPMRGGEFLDVALLESLWQEMGSALVANAQRHEGSVTRYLHAFHPAWNVAGRVCLHLAENKGDFEFPFAFIATYARQQPGRAGLQYVPLGRALKEYAGNRAKLLALLAPLQRATVDNEFLKELVTTGDIYHAMAWNVSEAHTFLTSAPDYELAGLVVRLPDWWRSKGQRRPNVSVRVGEKAPSLVGSDQLLDFDVRLTLGGDALTPEEIEQLLTASDGLVLIRGRWVEADPQRLREVLDNWTTVAQQARTEGVGFSKAMRLLSGSESAEEGSSEPNAWSRVIAGDWLTSTLAALRDPQANDNIEADASLNATLRPYQRAGVHWLRTLHQLGLGGCLADDMGLGKTIQVITLLALLKAKSESSGADLLIVPASLLGNWKTELEKFAPQLTVLIAHTSNLSTRDMKALSAEQFGRFDVIITTYGTAMRAGSIGQHAWRCVVLDEAQAIKNPGAKQTRAIKKLSATWRLALTGTPVENRLTDLWSLFDFLNPGLLGSAKAFGKLVNSMAEHPGDGYAPLRKLVEPYILRRLKTDRNVIADLPDKTEVTANCLLTKGQAALYQQSVGDFEVALRTTEPQERRGLVLSYLMRFKQICNHPSQWLGDGEFEPESSGKFVRLRELVEPIVERQEQLLVFTQFRSMTGPLERHLAACFRRSGLVLHGGTRVKRRSELVEQFQNGDAPFMVLSLKAAGTGLNLTAANHVIHFDRWWNPAVENQATDRAFRIGQKRNVLVQKFVCQGTVEERIDAMIQSKQALSDEVLTGSADVALTELSNDELVAMVTLDIHQAVSR